MSLFRTGVKMFMYLGFGNFIFGSLLMLINVATLSAHASMEVPLSTLLTTTASPTNAFTRTSTLLPMGVNFTDVRASFMDDGFTFENTPIVYDDLTKIVGISEGGMAILGLTGREDDLVLAGLMVAFPPDNETIRFENLAYLSSLLARTVPDWAAGEDWITESLPTVFGGTDVTTYHANREIRLSLVDEVGMIMLSIRVALDTTDLANDLIASELETVDLDDELIVMGISFSEIETNFTNGGFVFEDAPPLQAGSRRIVGQSENGLAVLELTGINDNLASASIIAEFPVYDDSVRMQNSAYFVAFMIHTMPEWGAGSDWLVESIPSVLQGEEVTIYQNGKEITLAPFGIERMIFLSIQGVSTSLDTPTPATQLVEPTATTNTPVPPTPTPELTAMSSTDTAACPTEGVQITSPTPNTAFTTRYVNVIGTANIPNFQLYKMEYSTNPDQPSWIYLFESNTPVNNDVLMELDTSTVPTGQYGLRLTVVDNSGNYPEPCVVWYSNGIAPPSADSEATQPIGDGFYTVGEDIAVGKWHSTGTGELCYWARLDSEQNILLNHFGVAGGTMTVQPFDYEIELNDCGTWIYVEYQEKIPKDDITASKSDGFYTVGVEIAPGRWRSNVVTDNCYWERMNDRQETLDNHFGQGGGTVTIQPTDYEIFFEGCGEWEYLGE